jgi:hypothetical protein
MEVGECYAAALKIDLLCIIDRFFSGYKYHIVFVCLFEGKPVNIVQLW